MTTATLPTNFKKQDDSPEAIVRAVNYAVTVAGGYLGHWKNHGPGTSGDGAHRPLAGVRVLEIGPGATLGVPVLLACAGARVAVADRFLARWDPDFHPPFLRALLERVDDRGARFTAPLRQLLQQNSFTPDVLEFFDCGAEHLGHIDRTFDLVLSNAVIEHVEDLLATAVSLAEITAPDGLGCHQVDFRDHRNFDRPLEYLTLDAYTFTTLRRNCFCECGCTWRAVDVAAAFEDTGFDVQTYVNLRTTPEYLADVRPRLQPEFAALPDDELLATSALFIMSRRTDGAGR